jgi:hypothetical protein
MSERTLSTKEAAARIGVSKQPELGLPRLDPNRAPIAEMDFVQTAVGKLYAPEGVRKKFSVSLAVLDELVQQRSIPHYRVRGSDLPLFSMSEVRE